MGEVKGVVFDLDDTLYPEREYVLSGFAYLAQRVAFCGETASEVRQFLVDGFNEGVRGDSFDRLREAFPEIRERFTVSNLIAIYRSHAPNIELKPAILSLLKQLRAARVPIALITDGPVDSQSAKIDALGLRSFCEPCIMTDEWGVEFRKPHPRAFLKVMNEWNIPGECLVYIADNPRKDFKAPQALGWNTIQLKTDRTIRGDIQPPAEEYAPAIIATSIEQLSTWLLEHVIQSIPVLESNCE